MGFFWLAAALLIIAALVFIWLPLFSWRRAEVVVQTANDQREVLLAAYRSRLRELTLELEAGQLNDTQFQALKTELQRNLVNDAEGIGVDISDGLNAGVDAGVRDTGKQVTPAAIRRWPLGLGLSACLLLVAIGMYGYLGHSQTLMQMHQQNAFAEELLSAAPEQRVVMLEARRLTHPDDLDTAYALVNEYMRAGDFDKARSGFENLVVASNEHPAVLAEYAQALFFIEGSRVTDKVLALSDRALAQQPENPTALGLKGIDAFEQQRYQDAIDYWQRVLAQRSSGAGADALRQGIARAEAMLAAGGADKTGAAVPEGTDPKSTSSENSPGNSSETNVELHVSIALAESLQAQTAPEDTVFVFARSQSGPPLPLAVVRMQVKDLPAELTLSDRNAMSPAAKLSSAQQVTLTARISKGGTPQAQAGDLQGEVGPIAVQPNSAQAKQSMIKIIIDNIVE